MTIDEAIEIIKRDDNHMRRGFFCINDFRAIETLVDCGKKYQKIEQIVNSKTTRLSYEDGFRQIKEVIEDGNDSKAVNE